MSDQNQWRSVYDFQEETYDAGDEVRRRCKRNPTRADVGRVHFTAVNKGRSIYEEAVEKDEEEDRKYRNSLTGKTWMWTCYEFCDHGRFNNQSN
jgi:hypothetical protein